ncbi:MAG: rod shape-determining protein MreD, partial [bacterium]|nr:rod shape-determining protein MreD [bacterium]
GIVVFQTSLADYFNTWLGIRPDGMLLAALFLGIYRGKETGVVGGFLLGLMEDVLSGGLLGVNALTKGLIGNFAGGLRRNVTSRDILFQGGLGFFATIFDITVSAFLLAIFLPDFPIPKQYWWEGAKSTILNAALGPVIIGLLGAAHARIIPATGGVPYPERV